MTYYQIWISYENVVNIISFVANSISAFLMFLKAKDTQAKDPFTAFLICFVSDLLPRYLV